MTRQDLFALPATKALAACSHARALAIPTPRWTTCDAVRNTLLLKDQPTTIQE